MPRYFFDVENGSRQHDETGIECRDLDEVRSVAMRTLSAIVSDEATGADRHCVTLLARDDAARPVFAATLCLTGFWLNARGEA